MRHLVSQLTYGSKLRSYQQRRSSITKSRIHLSRLKRLTLSAALTELWIGIALEWRHNDLVDIAFASKSGRQLPEFIVHSVRIPYQAPFTAFTDSCAQSENAGSVICDYIVDAVRFFQSRNQYKYLGAGLSQEVVRLSPGLPAKLWLDLDIVPITTRLNPDNVSSHGSDESSWTTSRSNSRVDMLGA